MKPNECDNIEFPPVESGVIPPEGYRLAPPRIRRAEFSTGRGQVIIEYPEGIDVQDAQELVSWMNMIAQRIYTRATRQAEIMRPKDAEI